MKKLLLALLFAPSIAFGQSAAYNLSQLAHQLLSGGTVPYSAGGTGLTSLTGYANDCLSVNSGATGFALTPCVSSSGTVTSFGFTNGNGFTGTVTNATTTPTLSLSLSLAAPGPIGGTTPGTGAFTTLSASGQFTSTVTTGTAPFAVSSTTQVANLQAATAGALAATPTTCTSTQAATGILANGNATGCFTPSGSGTVTDGSGTTTANELLLSSTTAHAYTNATTLPASAMPAVSGDVTIPAGTTTATVSKVNGASVPANANCLSSNSGSQLASGCTAPNRTVTTSPTVASTDMGGAIFMNVSGGGTLTIPAIGSGVFGNGQTLVVTNYSASTATVTTTPTVNSGGGCISGTGIPSGDSWQLVSNGTSLDCIQTTPTSSGSTLTSYYWAPTAGNTAVGATASSQVYLMPLDGPMSTVSFSQFTYQIKTNDATATDYYGLAVYGPCTLNATCSTKVCDSTSFANPGTGAFSITCSGTLSPPPSGEFYYVAFAGTATVMALNGEVGRTCPFTSPSTTTVAFTATGQAMPSSVAVPAASWGGCYLAAVAFHN